MIYPGTCRNKHLPFCFGRTIRLKTDQNTLFFNDRVFGAQYIQLDRYSGDYAIYRSDDLPNYILAASIDDAYENYTEIVRGADLLGTTYRQIHLANLLKLHVPDFMHIPIITNDEGEKLSKQTHAPALSKRHARSMLYKCLKDLGQQPPRSLLWRPVWATWDWAFRQWQPEKIPVVPSIPFNV